MAIRRVRSFWLAAACVLAVWAAAALRVSVSPSGTVEEALRKAIAGGVHSRGPRSDPSGTPIDAVMPACSSWN